jgi:hypothetical protein
VSLLDSLSPSTFDMVMTANYVPEPSSWALGCLGMAMVTGWGWRRRRKNKKDVAKEETADT